MFSSLKPILFSVPTVVAFVAVTLAFVALYFSFAFIGKVIATRFQKLQPIGKRAPGIGQVGREIRASLVSCVVFGLIGALTLEMAKSGYITIEFSPTLAMIIAEIFVLFLWNELHFYACHTALHSKRLLSSVHHVHHASLVPTPFSTYSFHWFEAAILGSVMLLYASIFPISFFGVLYLPIMSISINMLGHWNRSGGPFGAATVRHSHHHRYSQGNYGFLLTVFDRFFGTALDGKTYEGFSLPRVFTTKNKYPMGVFWLLITLTSYLSINHFSSGHTALAESSMDRLMPFLTWTIWIYLSYFLIFLVAFILENDVDSLNRYMWSALALNLLSGAVFLIFPTTLPRETAMIDGMNSATRWAFTLLHQIDRPTNCFPSLHVSTSYLAAFIWWKRRPRLFIAFFVWATAIAISTMTTRQHYAVDVVAGFAMALVVFRLLHRNPQKAVENVEKLVA